jgi:hypothetical protein
MASQCRYIHHRKNLEPNVSLTHRAWVLENKTRDRTDMIFRQSLCMTTMKKRECVHSESYYSKPSLMRLQLTWMSDYPDRNMKRFSSQLSTYFKRHVTFKKAHESLVCSDKTWRFFQTWIITIKNKFTVTAKPNPAQYLSNIPHRRDINCQLRIN